MIYELPESLIFNITGFTRSTETVTFLFLTNMPNPYCLVVTLETVPRTEACVMTWPNHFWWKLTHMSIDLSTQILDVFRGSGEARGILNKMTLVATKACYIHTNWKPTNKYLNNKSQLNNWFEEKESRVCDINRFNQMIYRQR